MAWPIVPTALVGVWERRWIARPGMRAQEPGSKETSVVVRYIQAAGAFVDVRATRGRWAGKKTDAASSLGSREGFAGVTTVVDGIVRWHACLNLWPPVADRAAAWAAAGSGRPLPTEDAGTMELQSDDVWHEHAWPDAGAYTEEWARLSSGAASVAARRGDDELLVVVDDWFGYARHANTLEGASFVAGKISHGWIVEVAACGDAEGKRLVVGGLDDWSEVPGSTTSLRAVLAAAGPPDQVLSTPPRPFVADPPTELVTDNLVLRPLRVEHVDADLEAVLDGATPAYSPLRHVFKRDDTWPHSGITREEDLVDLERHQAEFDLRLAFAFTVLDKSDRTRVVGCCYVNPPTRVADAEVFLWIRASADPALDLELETALRAWLSSSAWPFEDVVFPGRDADDARRDDKWAYWDSLPLSYARYPRIAGDATTVVLHTHTATGLIP